MTDYIKREDDYIYRLDALEAAARYCADDDGSCSNPNADLRELLDDIEAIPAADVVEVVRCKDCMHSCEWHNKRTGESGRVCELASEPDLCEVDDDHFCAYGERKKGEK